MPKLTYKLDEIDKEEGSFVGENPVVLADLKRHYVPVVNGFVISSTAFTDFLNSRHIQAKIHKFWQRFSKGSGFQVKSANEFIEKTLKSTPIPKHIEEILLKNFAEVTTRETSELVINPKIIYKDPTRLDIPTLEPLYFGNTTKHFLEAVKKLWSSLFNEELIKLRLDHSLGPADLSISLLVQPLIHPEVSGKISTIDYKTGSTQKILIESVWGIWSPGKRQEHDSYEIGKTDMKLEFKNISNQDLQQVRFGNKLREVPLSNRFKAEQKLTDEEIIVLAKIGKRIENFFGFPQSIHWSLSSGGFSIINTAALHPEVNENKATEKILGSYLVKIADGKPLSPGLATGPPKVIKEPRDLAKIKRGDVVITSLADPNLDSVIRKVKALVLENSDDKIRSAYLSKQLGIPCILGAKNASELFANYKAAVTVNGSTGQILRGGPDPKAKPQLAVATKKPVSSSLDDKVPEKTATKVFVTTGEKNLATDLAGHNVDGLLLHSESFFLAEKTHARKWISDKKQAKLASKLADYIKTFASEFDPRPIIYRVSNFQTNQLKALAKSGRLEPEEPDPSLGLHGGSRYIQYPEELKVELEAVKTVRNKMGLKNLWVAVPFVRTVEEMEEIKKIVSAVGLHRSESFKLLLVAQVPANIVLVDKFLEVGLDGVLVGLSDIVTLTLGADKNNQTLSGKFTELDPSVLWSLERVIKKCQSQGLHSGVIGQGAYFFPKLSEKLVGWGVSSISTSPQTIEETRKSLANSEVKAIRLRKP